MAKEIDAVTIPELLEGTLTASDYIPFSAPDGTMKRATAGQVAALVLVEPFAPQSSNTVFDL